MKTTETTTPGPVDVSRPGVEVLPGSDNLMSLCFGAAKGAAQVYLAKKNM